GRVTLEGEVEWNYQREYAERALRWIKGVKGVSNLIRLKPQVTRTEIKHKIEEGFRQRIDRHESCRGRSARRRGGAQRHCAILGGTARGGKSRLGGPGRYQSG